VETYTRTRYVSGLTWRSLLALLYGIVLFVPAAIWISLVTIGVNFTAVMQIALITLFVEFARYSGRPLTVQEATIIYVIASQLVVGQPIILVYRTWFVHSPIAEMFGLTGKIPTWWAPPYGSLAWRIRNLFHSDFMVPIGLYLLTQTLGTLGAFVFATMANEVFIEHERLPFPMEEVVARSIVVLAKREEVHLGILASTAFVGAIYGIILYTLPLVSGAAGYPISLMPIPWYDFTSYIETFMPGASFGIATDIMLLALGFILPSKLVLAMLVGTVARYIVLNWLTVHLHVTPWGEHYTPGMNLTMIYQESTLYLWASVIIGISFAVGLAPLFSRPRVLTRSLNVLFRGLSGRREERITERILSPKAFVILWIVVGVVFAVIYHLLDPQFSLLAGLIWEFPFMFLMMLITVRMRGEAGITWMFPYAQQAYLLLTGYKGITGWFLPLNMHPGVGWTSNFKVCQLTGTSYKSLMIAYFIALPISLLLGLLYTSAYWAMAPMPSVMYPATHIQWPVNAMYQALWITRPEKFFDASLILYSFLLTMGMGIALNFLRLGVCLTGILAGISSPIATVFTIFLGNLIGRVIIFKLGMEYFNRYKQTIAAGLMLGEGIAIMIGTAGAIILKSIQLRPY